jgi:hypothetical protein
VSEVTNDPYQWFKPFVLQIKTRPFIFFWVVDISISLTRYCDHLRLQVGLCFFVKFKIVVSNPYVQTYALNGAALVQVKYILMTEYHQRSALLRPSSPWILFLFRMQRDWVLFFTQNSDTAIAKPMGCYNQHFLASMSTLSFMALIS